MHANAKLAPKAAPRTDDAPPRPDARVAARVEELLREQLEDMGVAISSLSPGDIAAGMTCALAPNGSMTYAWEGQPVLHVLPEKRPGPDGNTILWRMFTKDDMPSFPHNDPKPL